MSDPQVTSKQLDSPARKQLLAITQQYGTPCYAFDIRGFHAQADKLRSHLPDVEILYSLKANASLGIADVFADYGLGADVASAGELATAVEAGFSADKIFVAGPYKSPETVSQLRSLPEAIVSIDSPHELRAFDAEGLKNRVVLRLRPDFGSCAVVPAGSESRFGATPDMYPECRDLAKELEIPLIGFHVFAGSQVLDVERLIGHLRGALDLSLRAADEIGIQPEYINLGGGFGTPYAADEEDFDLATVGETMQAFVSRAKPARLVLELGRFLVAQAGWYLTTVVGYQTHQGRPAVIVDGGSHQRADICGLSLRHKARPPLVLTETGSDVRPTDVMGCLSLPADVLCEAGLLPDLSVGDVIAFPNAGAYGIWSSPAIFHGSPLPAEVAFDGSDIHLMRAPKEARSILDGQHHISKRHAAAQI